METADFDGMYTGCDYDAETGLTYHWNRWRSEDGSCFISEDPARDGANWYGYAGQNPMVYVDRIGLFYYTAEGQQSSTSNTPKTDTNDSSNKTPPNQGQNITGPSNSVEVVPLYENSDDYNNAVLSQGTKKKRSWFSINVEEPITKFIARNIFGLTPSDYVMLSDRTIVPMSKSGTQFAYSERVVDCMSFCGSFLAGFGKGGKATRFIVKNGDEIAGAVKEVIKSTDNIPSNVTDALSYIKKGDCVPGANGGKTFKNRGGINPKTGNINQELPKVDSSGKAITYAEWDVNAKLPGASRDAERIVTGSDGSIWWTKDHYETFTRLE